MKSFLKVAKSIAIVAMFVASTTLFGCNAADLAGPEQPQSQSDCEGDCSNGRNL